MQRPVSGYNQKDMEKHSKEQEKNHKKLADNANPKSKKNYVSRLVDAAAEVMEAGERYVHNDFAYRNAPMPLKTQNWKKSVENDKKTRDAERGQFFGALLQGREYDSQGKQIKKSNKKK